MTTIRYPALLRYALTANAVFSALSGMLLTLGGRRIVIILGLRPLVSLWPVGLALLLFSGYVYLVARKREPDILSAQVIITADVLWVLGSMIAVLFGPLSATGNAVVSVVAVIVLSFAILQSAGIRGAGQQFKNPRSKSRLWSRRVVFAQAHSSSPPPLAEVFMRVSEPPRTYNIIHHRAN
jgi:hypothetical protein